MSLLVWSPSLSVNIKEIDDQHRRMIHYINELHDSAQQGKDPVFLRGLIDKLVAYKKEHFALEEKYFAQLKYPEAETHIREHEAFSQQLEVFEKQAEAAPGETVLPLAKFLADWILTHIQETDMAYAEFFNARGLT